MEDNTSSNDTTPCYASYFDSKFQVLIGLRTSLSFVSALFLLSLVGLIVLFRKYLFFTQRLIMYIAIAQMSFSLVNTVDLAALMAYENQSALHYCQAIGFITQMTNWWGVLSILIISVDIFLKVALPRLKTEKYEIPYLLIIFALPLLFNWIPFIKSSYGPSVYFCWIRASDLTDCTLFAFGLWLRVVLYYVPLFTIMIVIFLLLLAARIIIARRRTGNYDPGTREKIVKEMKPLVAYPIIFLVANITSLVTTTYISLAPRSAGTYVISLITTAVFRLQGILIALVFILDPETRKKLRWKYIRAAARSFYAKSEGTVYEVKAVHSDSVAVCLEMSTIKNKT